jgi:preprotein translocase subunit SecB
MAEEELDAAGNGQTSNQASNQATMSIQHVFLKDCSFEAPGALGMDQSQGQPDMNMNLSQRVNQHPDDRYEVVLTVTVTAKQGEATAFIAEVHYGGLFQLKGFNEQQLPYVLNVHCPNTLYPYARSEISKLIAAGGFFTPPMQPINFEAIFAQRMADGQQQAGADGNGASGESQPQ